MLPFRMMSSANEPNSEVPEVPHLKPSQIKELRHACYQIDAPRSLQTTLEALVQIRYDTGLRLVESLRSMWDWIFLGEEALAVPLWALKCGGSRDGTIAFDLGADTVRTLATLARDTPDRADQPVFTRADGRKLEPELARHLIITAASASGIEAHQGSGKRVEPSEFPSQTLRNSTAYRLRVVEGYSLEDTSGRLGDPILEITSRRYEFWD
ncbi:hypothetical protein [Halobellus sp. EA9]|uniref:hypothetical protein n=1 Tax=Halobellus sp. EA9 TaxID=3421647 RepID=UPI003EB80DC6